jgi:hypothetical protein
MFLEAREGFWPALATALVAGRARGHRPSGTDQHEARIMDEQLTLRILAWVMGSVVLACFVLSAVSLPH